MAGAQPGPVTLLVEHPGQSQEDHDHDELEDEPRQRQVAADGLAVSRRGRVRAERDAEGVQTFDHEGEGAERGEYLARWEGREVRYVIEYAAEDVVVAKLE